MNRGPVSKKVVVDHNAKAIEAWGNPPEWILALAQACNLSSQSKVAAKLNYSAATISQVISCSYRGDIERVEAMVRGAFLSELVACPVLGDMPRNMCLGWQKKPRAATSSHRVQMYRACRNGCPNSKLEGGQS